MRLEVGSIHIRDVEIGRATALSDHTLVIDPEELRTLVLEDSHFADVRVHLVKPGESVRVISAALVDNLLVAVTKLVAARVTGSSAMVSESVHSLV